MRSLSRRLTLWLVGTTAAMALGTGAALYAYVQHELVREFDAGMLAKARVLGSLLRIESNGRFEFDYSDGSMPEYLPARHAEFFQVIGPDGKILERSASLKGATWIDPKASFPHDQAWDLTLPNGRDGRARAFLTVAHLEDEDRDVLATRPALAASRPAIGSAPAIVLVARDRSDLNRVLATLATALAAAAVVLTGASVVAVRWAVRHGLQPVHDLADRTTAIGPDTLDLRFDPGALPAELQPIGRRLNDLLDRLEQAFRRERRVNADIAHELRTPIAELRSLTEVATRWPGTAEESAAYLRDAHEVALRMDALVESLLMLARSQSQAVPARREPMELGPVVQEVVRRREDAAATRGLSVRVDVPDGLWVSVDRHMFRRIVENLVSNATDHARAGGRIEVVAKRAGTQCTLAIANSNDSLVPDDLRRLFEPFWRKDASRTGDAHAGLGLALVAEYARQNGIAVSTRLVAADWFVVELSIPIADATTGATEGPTSSHVPVMVPSGSSQSAD